jgi:hypothetical protein
MAQGDQLKYGIIKGEKSAPRLSIPVGASEVIPAGGAFVKSDGSGRAEIAGDGTTLLAGYIFPSDTGLDAGQEYETTNSTEGVPVVPFLPISAMLGVVVRLPVTGGTYAATMLGKTADLEVVSSMQGVQLDASAEDTVIVVGGDAVNNRWVDVMVNPDKITGLTGVA